MVEDDFDRDEAPVNVAERLAAEALIVDVDGFEGPLDLLLTLSRTQKVDLLPLWTAPRRCGWNWRRIIW